jgi:hypothetical protein
MFLIQPTLSKKKIQRMESFFEDSSEFPLNSSAKWVQKWNNPKAMMLLVEARRSGTMVIRGEGEERQTCWMWNQKCWADNHE